MNFIYEKVNEADLKQYNLKDFQLSYWVIDKAEDTFLFGGGLTYPFRQHVMDESDFVNDYLFYLWSKGEMFEVHLAKGIGTLNLKDLKEGEPWVYVWDGLLSMTYQDEPDKAVETDIIDILKDALAVFGGGFKNRYFTNFIVKFNF